MLADRLGARVLIGFTPLGLAIERKNLTIAKWLISKGASVEKKFGGGETLGEDELGASVDR